MTVGRYPPAETVAAAWPGYPAGYIPADGGQRATLSGAAPPGSPKWAPRA